MAMPAFTEKKVAVVQAPQDYRDGGENWFQIPVLRRICRVFFRVGMVERSEHNAIIQHGTMCVVRRAALEEVGRWSEWCITEDTELGLRLFEAGHTAVYIPVTLGRGLMPDTYDAYKSQRYRWVYGAMQIMKRHSAAIFRGKSKLTWAQRYHFIAGWIPWMADGLALIFAVFALIWTALMVIAPKHFDVPLTALSSVVLALFAIKTVKTVLAVPGQGRLGLFRCRRRGPDRFIAGLHGGNGRYRGPLHIVQAFSAHTEIRSRRTVDSCAPSCGYGKPSCCWRRSFAIAATAIVSQLDDPAERGFGWRHWRLWRCPMRRRCSLLSARRFNFAAMLCRCRKPAPVFQPSNLDLSA